MASLKTRKNLAAFTLAALAFSTLPAQTPSGRVPAADSNSAIVVFTGDDARIVEGLRLYMQGHANTLFITGIEMAKIDLHKLCESAGITITRPLEEIEIDELAQTTYENAINTRLWIEKRNIGQIILVTSDYHMPRSHYLLERQLKYAARIPYELKPHEVRSSSLSLAPWESEARKFLITTRFGIPTNFTRLVQLTVSR